MRRNKSEKQVLREADRIASMKEDLDAISWSRVSEIAKELQEDMDLESRQELGRELLSISQANTSLLGKFGTSSALSGTILPSGIEVLNAMEATSAIEGTAPSSFEPGEPAGVLQKDPLSSVESAPKQEDVSLSVLLEDRESQTDFEGASAEELSAPADILIPELPLSEEVGKASPFFIADVSPEDIIPRGVNFEDQVQESQEDQVPFEAHNAQASVDSEEAQSQEEPTASKGWKREKKLKAQDLAQFRQLYSSKKGSLCVYEDAFGHLVAVDSSKFA